MHIQSSACLLRFAPTLKHPVRLVGGMSPSQGKPASGPTCKDPQAAKNPQPLEPTESEKCLSNTSRHISHKSLLETLP